VIFVADEVEGRRDLVVIGASAGGVETLRRVVAGLPGDLPAAICVVLHIAPGSPSALASILERAGPLPCRPAADGDYLRAGRILVAQPDHHLEIKDDRVRLTIGPRENGHRPAVDVLFRSAAAARDGRVIGVVLSGTRDDGAAGLAVIKAGGGGTIVQDPEEALYGGMPANALAHVAVDAVVPSEHVARVVTEMVNASTAPIPTAPEPPGGPGDNPATPSGAVTTVCPECGGVLTERDEAGMTQWKCRVGHRYSPASLADAQAEGAEAALWAAIHTLEDRVSLLTRIAEQADVRRQPRSAHSFRRRAESAGEQAGLMRSLLESAASTTLRRVDGDEARHDQENAA
jgi:two-component system chemotaxis response regulator CheB